MAVLMWDEPGLFDPLEAWEQHLEAMKRLPEDEPLRDLAIEEAKAVIERKRKDASAPL